MCEYISHALRTSCITCSSHIHWERFGINISEAMAAVSLPFHVIKKQDLEGPYKVIGLGEGMSGVQYRQNQGSLGVYNA